MSKREHTVCRVGAAVRVDGYIPAVVTELVYDTALECWHAPCRVTAKHPTGPYRFNIESPKS